MAERIEKVLMKEVGWVGNGRGFEGFGIEVGVEVEVVDRGVLTAD